MNTESSSSGTVQEDTSSLQDKYHRCTDVITSDEMDAYLEKGKIMDIVLVKDQCNTPYILVGSKDDPSTKEWIRYRGESEDQINKFIEWRSKSKELHGRSLDELNELRQSVMALARVKGLLRLDDEEMTGIFDAAVMSVATDWYNKDKQQQLNYKELTEEQLDILSPYVLHVSECLKQIFGIIATVKANASSGGGANVCDYGEVIAGGSAGSQT